MPTAKRTSAAALRRTTPQPARGPRTAAAIAEPADRVGDRFFRQLVSSMRNGVLAVTRDGALAAMNGEAYRVFGLRPDPGDIGRQYSDVLRAHQDIVRVLASAFELNHLPNRAELRLKGSGRVIGYTLSLVRDPDGEVTGAALFFKDLTRVEQIEERERLRDRLAALGEMAAAIAHELKNPLAGIEVMAGLLRRKVPESPDAQSILTDIINEAKMANTTVVEVLDYVRPVRLETERTSLADVLHDSVTMAESKARRGEVSVDLQVPSDLPSIQGDRHQLCQVFTNLIVNAFEALDGRGSIAIRAQQGVMDDYQSHPGDHPAPSPAIIVRIADDGPGVPAEMADRIFNAFFTTKAQGSGLGLAIVRKIVDAHDGRIDVSSVPGQGTRFTVTLPVAGGQDWFQ